MKRNLRRKKICKANIADHLKPRYLIPSSHAWIHSSWFLTFGFGLKFSKFFAFDTLFFKKRKIVFKNKIGLADDLVFKYNCNELW